MIEITVFGAHINNELHSLEYNVQDKLRSKNICSTRKRQKLKNHAENNDARPNYKLYQRRLPATPRIKQIKMRQQRKRVAVFPTILCI